MPKALICPQCLQPCSKLREVGTSQDAPQLGDILLCGDCATVSQIDLVGNAVKLTQEEFDALDPAELRDLNFAVRNCIHFAKRFQQNNQDYITKNTAQ